ncbi:MAG: hypothetical protein WED07_02910 [Candidatus Freyarchaeum deiterrae]
MEDTIGKKQENKTEELDPLIQDDCVRALISGYTSDVGECRFFSDSVESKCFLDPYSRRPWNCEGKCFVKGYRCEYISDAFSFKSSLEEIYFLISLIGQNGTNIISSLGWSVLSTEEVLAVSGIKKEEADFTVSVLKLLKLICQKNGKLTLTDRGRTVHDYLLTRNLV